MKRWLKKHGRWLVIGLGILCIISNVVGILAGKEEMVAFHIFVIAIMVIFILLISGAIFKFLKWWEKD